jgi:hypothetical protein
MCHYQLWNDLIHYLCIFEGEPKKVKIKILNDQQPRCWDIIHVYVKFHFNKMNSKSNCCVEIEKNELLWEYIKCQDFMPIFFWKLSIIKNIT